jgi:outer membrane protein
MPFVPPAQVQQQPAPAPLALDMAAALSRARQENPLLRAAKARVEERQGLITTVRADALPQLSLTGDFTRVRDVSILSSGFGDAAGAFGLDPRKLVGARNMYTTSAAITQPLFYWGKLGTAVEIAQMGAREAEAGFTTSELDILHGVAKAYLAVLMTQADLEVLEARKRTAERFVVDVKAKLEAQTATELDRLRAESEYLAVLPDQLQALAATQRATEVLNGQLGLDPRTPLQLGDLGLPGLDALPKPVERSEITQLHRQEEMFQANDRILQADLRPKFDLTGSYGYQAGKSDLLFREPYDAWRVGITMKFTFFDGLRSSGKRAQNRAQLEQVRQLRVDRERAIAVERSSAEREIGKAQALAEAARKAYEAGSEALRMSRESFEQGLITSLDLLQAERTERQLESQRRRATLGLWSALLDYRRAMGLPPL